MSDQPGSDLSPRAERFLRSVLPIGVIALVIWIAWLVVELAFGDPERFSVVTAVIGLATSIVTIASGLAYRRALDRR